MPTEDLEPGRWHPLSADDARSWRARALERVGGKRGKVFRRGRGRLVGPGGSIEGDVVRVNETERADHVGDSAVVATPTREAGTLDARAAVDVLAKDMIDWVRSDPKLYRHRLGVVVRAARAMGGLSGLTDEEAADQLHVLCEKVARADAEKVFAEDNLSRPVLIMPRL